jgi:hypothetical protein
MLKICYCYAERTIILDRGHPAQTEAVHEPCYLTVPRISVAMHCDTRHVADDAPAPIDEDLSPGPVL